MRIVPSTCARMKRPPVKRILRAVAARAKVPFLAVNLASRTAAVGKKALLSLGIALLVSTGLLGPQAVPLVHAAFWYLNGGPPLDLDAPRDGQVIAHIDVLGKLPPDIARIRVS